MSSPSPSAPLAILFTDVEGSTKLHTERGDAAAAAMLGRHAEVVAEEATKCHGRVIKNLGDGFMVVFGSVRGAIQCAAAIQRAHARGALEDPERSTKVRIGVNVGEVTERDGDVFGEAVNAAARIVSVAKPDQILVSRVVRDLAGTMPEIPFIARGTAELKGFPEPWELFEAVWRTAEETPDLTIRLLGDFGLRLAGDPIHGFEAPRLQSLIASLVLNREPRARQQLAFSLWPESTEPQARTNLRQLLHNLRNALPDADRFFDINARSVGLRPDARIHVDVTAFEAAAARADSADAGRDALAEAVRLYRGDLLPASYDEWVLSERERLRHVQIQMLERLAKILEEEGDVERAVSTAEALLRFDPLHEATYRHLMRLHARAGDRARALRVYHTCATVLERELGVEPSVATKQVYDELRGGGPETLTEPQAAAARVVASPLIGRDAEWQQLLACWSTVSRGRSHMAVITGEPGIGKSRLLEELRNWCSRNSVATAHARAYEAQGRVAYAPVAAMLRSEVIRPTLNRLDQVWLTEISRLLPELLTEHPGLPHPEPLIEAEQRQHLFEALSRALGVETRPLLLVLDDLQWCDADTLELLHFLIGRNATAPLMIAGTARDAEIDAEHPATRTLSGLRALESLTEIPLAPLDPESTTALVKELADLDDEVAGRLYHESEGNPLFLIELVRAGATGSADPEPSRTAGTRLPARVQSVIEGRLGGLSEAARDVVSVAATIGREFTFDVVVRAAGREQDDVIAAIDELWQRRIIREQGADAYDFGHDKIREVAYAVIGPGRRRKLHADVARALVDCYGETNDTIAAQLAAHHEQGGQAERAVVAYRRAAEHAASVFAADEVVSLLTRGNELIAKLPASTERDELELSMVVPLAVALVNRQGYAFAGAREAWSRARALCQRLGKPLTAPILRGLALQAISRSDLDEAVARGNDLLALGTEQGDEIVVAEGLYVLGVSTYWQGRFEESRVHLQATVDAYRPERHRDHIMQFAQDPKVICLVRLGGTLWQLGFPERGARARDEAVALGEELGHPFSLGYALTFAAWHADEARDDESVERFARAAADLAREKPMAYWAATADYFLGWNIAKTRDPAAGIEVMRSGFEQNERIGNQLHTTYALVRFAEAHALLDDMDEANRVIERAHQLTREWRSHYLEAEVLRVRAEFLRRTGGDASEIESLLRTALSVAESQRALSRMLQVALSLGRWWAAEGTAEQRSEVSGLLTATLDRFTEGAHTHDQREAEQLLAELS